jgi:hypothetical protein
VPNQDNSALKYLQVLNEAERQLDWGTDFEAMENAALALRQWDPHHRLLPALDMRIRQVVRVKLLMTKAKLASHRAVTMVDRL